MKNFVVVFTGKSGTTPYPINSFEQYLLPALVSRGVPIFYRQTSYREIVSVTREQRSEPTCVIFVNDQEVEMARSMFDLGRKVLVLGSLETAQRNWHTGIKYLVDVDPKNLVGKRIGRNSLRLREKKDVDKLLDQLGL